MKKIIALLCIVMILCTCAACSKQEYYDEIITDETTESTESIEVHDPQKENAIPTDDLSRYATNTGSLTNYRIAAGYTSTTENVVTIIMHDGENQQSRRVLHNTINPDGAATLSKHEEYRLVWSENAKYTSKDNEEVKADYTFEKPAAETTFAVVVDELVCPGFYDAIITNMSTATYNIIKDYYELDPIEIAHNGETMLFSTIYITVSGNRIESIHCDNGTQSITIELTGVNDVKFGGNE